MSHCCAAGFCFLALFSVYAENDKVIPQIQRQPPRSFLIKKEGDALDLKCSVNGCPTLQLDWLYRSKPITLSKHTQIISSSDSTSLKINRLTKQDEGQYTCVAINTVGRNKKDFWIVVQPKQPKKAQVLQPPKDIVAIDGDTVQFSCVITYLPQAPFPQAWAWFKNGKRADENQKRQWLEMKMDGDRKNISITISNVQIEDRGVYGCYVLLGNFRNNSAIASATLTISP